MAALSDAAVALSVPATTSTEALGRQEIPIPPPRTLLSSVLAGLPTILSGREWNGLGDSGCIGR